MGTVNVEGEPYTYKYLMSKRKDWLTNIIINLNSKLNKLEKKLKIQENIIDEDTFIIEVKNHKKVSSLTPSNKNKKVIYINGEPVGKINKVNKKWEARLLKKDGYKRPKTKLEAILAVVSMYLGDIK